MATAYLQIHAGPHQECQAWSTAAVSTVLQCCVTGSAGAQTAARRLFDAISTDLRRLGARSRPPLCGGGLTLGLTDCLATRNSGAVRRVLVCVFDASGASPAEVTPFDPGPWTRLVVLLPTGASPGVLPAWAQSVNAIFYDCARIAAAMPAVLVAAGLSLESFRVFLSYRRDDAATFADQLFAGLSAEQFDVYLDRFCTQPAEDFVERIRFELADKACVVLLDSANAGASPWMRGEYGIARLYRLGLMAIDLPSGVRSYRRIGTRLDLRPAHPGPFSGTTPLSAPAVAQAVSFVKDNFAAQVWRRFRHQRDLVRSAAQLVGLASHERADGLVEAQGPHGRLLVAGSARPPGLEPFRRVADALTSQPGPVQRLVVGPLHAHMHAARTDLAWLAQTADIPVVDERRLLPAMSSAAQGRAIPC